MRATKIAHFIVLAFTTTTLTLGCSGSDETLPDDGEGPGASAGTPPSNTGGEMNLDPSGQGGDRGVGTGGGPSDPSTGGKGGSTADPVQPTPIEPCSFEEEDDRWLYSSVNILVYRFEFPDAPFEWEEQQLREDLDQVAEYFWEQSYGRFVVTYEIHDEVFMNESPKTVFDDDWHAYREWYSSTIAGLGVDPEDPGPEHRIMVTSPQIGNFNSSGGPPLMTVFHYGPGTIAHELGHTLGLRHSKALEAGQEIVGVGDYDTEALNYGNVYGLMGMGAHSLEEINLLYKHYFGWLTCDEVPTVTESGTYRIHAFDRGAIGGEHIGLNLVSGNGEYRYWAEYRTRGGHATGDGVLLNLQGYFENEEQEEYWKTTSYLLDMTPESLTTEGWWADDQTDSELLIGQTYADHWGGFEITPIAKGGSTVDESAWIDVEVTLL